MDLEEEALTGAAGPAMLETGIEPPSTGLLEQAAGVNPVGEVESQSK
jgi:hypothetical protein